MRYSASLLISSRVSSGRLRALVAELTSLDCQVRLDRKASRLEFDLPDDLYSWIRAGGLGTLLSSYGDVIRHPPRFHELVEPYQEPRRLPAPGRRMRA